MLPLVAPLGFAESSLFIVAFSSALGAVPSRTFNGDDDDGVTSGVRLLSSLFSLVTERNTTLKSDSNQLPISLEDAVVVGGFTLSELILPLPLLSGEGVRWECSGGVRGGVVSPSSSSLSDDVVVVVGECGRDVSKSGSHDDDDDVESLAGDCERVRTTPTLPPNRVGGDTAIDSTRCWGGGCCGCISFM